MTDTPMTARPADGADTDITMTLVVMLITVGYVMLMSALVGTFPASDFRALWLAGQSLLQGDPGSVYPADTTVFTMQPPAGWAPLAQAQGFEGDSFPFIYPPLWAWLAGHLATAIPFATADTAMRALNPVLLVAMLLLARRLAAPTVPVLVYLLAGLAFMTLTPVGLLALAQNQPQILVGFMMLLALERLESGHPRAAGVVLAVAAAIKIYPVLIAVVWLLLRQWRAVAAFALTGAALAVASVAVAGWPLHAEFLHMLGVISRTAMITSITYTADASLAQFLFPDSFHLVRADTSADGPVAYGWLVMAKPLALRLVTNGLTVMTLWLAARSLARRSDATDRAAIWAAVLILLSLLGPISWCYHYIAPLAFLPMLFARMRATAALAIITGAGAVLTMVSQVDLPAAAGFPWPKPVIGTLDMLALALVFGLLPARDSRAPAAPALLTESTAT